MIAYCRIGERSSHTWFVLHYLLGYDKVRNYDGSWTEWGNAVRAPIETIRILYSMTSPTQPARAGARRPGHHARPK